MNPEKSFVFAGPLSTEFIPDWFFKTDNIYTTGRLDYAELPAVLKGFDIAMIPFRKDQVSNTIFPLKLFEYLGAGKPVISTDFNTDLKSFTKGTVQFCSNSKAFSESINHELHTNSHEKIDQRIAVSEENTWKRRAAEFSELLRLQLDRKL